MRKNWRLARWALVLTALGFTACDNPTRPTDAAPTQTAFDRKDGDDDEDRSRSTIPFDDAEVFFEFNTTANDLGLQVFLDAEGWKRLSVSDPRRREIVGITAEGNLAELGITELRFESAEPSPTEVLAMFRPGVYEFRGRTVEGDALLSRATLSHGFLTPPTFSPANGQTVNRNSTVVLWNAPGAARVEVIIEQPDFGDVFDVIVPGSVTSLGVPAQFLRPGTEYKIEILAIGTNGNRTIAESTFVTM
jgi:hypothetical protein